MNKGEKGGIATIVIGVIYTILAYNMKRATIGNPIEPKVFPLLLGVVMTLSGIALYIIQHKKKVAQAAKNNSEKLFTWNFETKMIAFICSVSVLYGIFYEKLGYVISTTLFLGALLLAFHGGKKKVTNLVIAFGFSVAIYYCFSQVLGIPLPKVPGLNI